MQKAKKAQRVSREQKITRHVSLLRRMLHEYPARKWKIDIDGEDVSVRYILLEAMNIRSIGPALYLASQAATRDGQLDFVCARESDRSVLMDHLDARLAGEKPKFPLPIRRLRKLQVVWQGSAKLHLDDKLWPRKKREAKHRREIEVTVRQSALVVLLPGRDN